MRDQPVDPFVFDRPLLRKHGFHPPLALTHFDPRPIPSSALEEFYVQADKLSRLHSLPMSLLSSVLRSWQCSMKGCDREGVGFGPYLQDDSKMIPYALHCGHYICATCKRKLVRLKKGFVCTKSVQSLSCPPMTPEDVRKTPVAAHILNVIPVFRSMGIACTHCPRRTNRLFEVFRYPIELMNTYYDGSSSSPYAVPHYFQPEWDSDLDEDELPRWKRGKTEEDDDKAAIAARGYETREERWRREAREKKREEEVQQAAERRARGEEEVEEEKPVSVEFLCHFCAVNTGPNLTGKVLPLSTFEEWEDEVPTKMRIHIRFARSIARDLVTVDEYMNKCRRKTVFSWHASHPAIADMAEYLDELLACPCEKAYSALSNPPVMLACGHLCCAACEKEILAKKARCPWNGGTCTGPDHTESKWKTPKEYEQLLQIPLDDVRMCSKCSKYHAESQFIAGPGEMQEEVETCVYCIKGIEVPPRGRTKQRPKMAVKRGGPTIAMEMDDEDCEPASKRRRGVASVQETSSTSSTDVDNDEEKERKKAYCKELLEGLVVHHVYY